MGKINVPRIISGGILAGLIINIFEGVAGALYFQKEWDAAMRALNKPVTMGATQMSVFWIWGFLMGISMIWLYAAIRPRFGAGPKTAVIAGLLMWFVGYLLSMVPPIVMDLFPANLMMGSIALGLVEVLVAAQAGAWLYKEA